MEFPNLGGTICNLVRSTHKIRSFEFRVIRKRASSMTKQPKTRRMKYRGKGGKSASYEVVEDSRDDDYLGAESLRPTAFNSARPKVAASPPQSHFPLEQPSEQPFLYPATGPKAPNVNIINASSDITDYQSQEGEKPQVVITNDSSDNIDDQYDEGRERPQVVIINDASDSADFQADEARGGGIGNESTALSGSDKAIKPTQHTKFESNAGKIVPSRSGTKGTAVPWSPPRMSQTTLEKPALLGMRAFGVCLLFFTLVGYGLLLNRARKRRLRKTELAWQSNGNDNEVTPNAAELSVTPAPS